MTTDVQSFSSEFYGIGNCSCDLVSDDDGSFGLDIKAIELGLADFLGEDIDVLT